MTEKTDRDAVRIPLLGIAVTASSARRENAILDSGKIALLV
jgi:hypothetical protein